MRIPETFRAAAVSFLIASVFYLACPPPAFSQKTQIGLPPPSSSIRIKVPPKHRRGVFAGPRRLMAPPGFEVSVFAAGLKEPRFMATDPQGNIYVSLPSEGKVVAFVDKNNDGIPDKTVVFAEGLDRPHGLAFRGTELIVAETGKLIILKDTNGDLKADTAEVLTDDIPPGGGHWTRTVVLGPDGNLYVSVGSSCNACVEDDKRRASILRFSDGKATGFATGLRNSVGMAWSPVKNELWAVDNGRDFLGDDLPPDELNKIVQGGDYGWPNCYGDRVMDAEIGNALKCKETIPPVEKLQAHSAPLGMAFGTGLDMAREFQDALFIAFHGSWNRTTPTGYKVVAVPFHEGSNAGPPVDFLTGWLDSRGKAWGRPVGLLAGKDGALYLSDDLAGAIYRISFKKTPSKKAKGGD
ncbi:MAG: sorbosone dehydrogenase family protein [Deltaproteobacteria bacterium]|nr:sorbosone dehydrogenase family protein [Deltaproteobacteria bacterium]